MTHRVVRRPLAAALALTAALALVVPAAPGTAAPGPGPSSGASTGSAAATDRGPRLQVPAARLDRSLTCDGDASSSRGRPVLLVPGTGATPEVNFSWNYERVFTAQGRAWCAVTLPAHATGDIQVAAEYVTHGIRTLHRRAGERISVLGHSQGGMVPRWSLKYWPDTRRMVDDVIGMAPSNHGTILSAPACATTCQPALRQQGTRSAFLRTLNRGGETQRGISYTQVWSAADEVVVPNVPGVPGVPPSSRLTTGLGRISNIPVQSVCPNALTDHLNAGTSDPVVFAAVMDALGHPGPARPSRLDRAVCAQLLFPGIDPVTYPTEIARALATLGQSFATQPRTDREPALRGYTRL